MKKKIIAVIGAMAILMSATLVGCNKTENTENTEKKDQLLHERGEHSSIYRRGQFA